MGKFLVPPLQCWVESAPNPLVRIWLRYFLIHVGSIAFIQVTPVVTSLIDFRMSTYTCLGHVCSKKTELQDLQSFWNSFLRMFQKQRNGIYWCNFLNLNFSHATWLWKILAGVIIAPKVDHCSDYIVTFQSLPIHYIVHITSATPLLICHSTFFRQIAGHLSVSPM